MIEFRYRRNFLIGSSVMLLALPLSACMETGEDLQDKAVKEAIQENVEPHILSLEGLTDLAQITGEDFANSYIQTFIKDTTVLSTLSEFINHGDLLLTEEQAASNVEAFLTELKPALLQLRESQEQITLYKAQYIDNATVSKASFAFNETYSMSEGGQIDFEDLPSEETVEQVQFLLIESPKENEPFAQEAKERTEQLLAHAKSITTMYDVGDKINAAGDHLMYVLVDNQLIQEILVREGLAKIANENGQNTMYYDRLQKAQAAAQSEGVGIWSMQ